MAYKSSFSGANIRNDSCINQLHDTRVNTLDVEQQINNNWQCGEIKDILLRLVLAQYWLVNWQIYVEYVFND